MLTLEMLKTWEAVATLVTLAFGGASALVYWLDRRAQSRADDAKSDVLKEHRDFETRMSALELKVGEVVEDMERVGRKVSDIDRDMQKVATSDAVSQLRVEMAGMAASLRATSGMVDTIYRAATRAAVEPKQ